MRDDPHCVASAPPVDLPPGYTVTVRGRGEFFIRVSGGAGPAGA